VLDTNIVLDCLVFKNQASTAILNDVCIYKLQWIATPEMRDELAEVLARGLPGSKRGVRWEDLQPQWSLWVTPAAAPASRPPYFPRCTDEDDQIFIDLALSHRARWLISRDRAVLKLAGRCQKLGLSVLTPEQWIKAR
jgi:predicted nucleic acid-binding protein